MHAGNFLAAQLAGVVQTEGDELTVMRDRVIWMPAIAVFHPPRLDKRVATIGDHRRREELGPAR